LQFSGFGNHGGEAVAIDFPDFSEVGFCEGVDNLFVELDVKKGRVWWRFLYHLVELTDG